MSYHTYIDIKDLDKAVIIQALINAAKPTTDQKYPDITLEECEALLKLGTHFSTVNGKKLGVSMADKYILKQRLYNEYNGPEAAEKVIKELMNKPKGLGSSLDSFLEGEGILDEVDEAAQKRVKEMEEEDEQKKS